MGSVASGRCGRKLQWIILGTFLCLHFTQCWASEKAAACLIGPPYDRHSIVSIFLHDAEHLATVEGIMRQHCQVSTFSGEEAHAGIVNRYIVTREQAHALRANSAAVGEVKVDVESVGDFIDSLPKQKSGYMPLRTQDASLATQSALRASIDETFYKSYHTYEDLVGRFEELIANNPGLVRGEIVGQTFEGRNIFALRIGKTSATNPKRILFNGLQHAREWIAPMVPAYIAEKLVAKLAAGNNTVSRALQGVEFTIIPVVNPDGYVYTRDRDRFWRKNRRNDTSCEAGGVDLNRNWAVDFGGTESTSTDPCSSIYPGSAAFSEPETDAIRKFVETVGGFVAHIDFHSYSQLVLGGIAYNLEEPPRANQVEKLGKLYRDAIFKATRTAYTFGKWGEVLYKASGTMQDWMTSVGALAYTAELRPSADNPSIENFVLEEAQILPTCKENWRAAKAMLRFVAKLSYS